MQNKLLILLSLLFGLTACTTDNGEDDPTLIIDPVTTTDTSGDDLETFSVEFDTEALNETESIPTDATAYDYEDYVENEDGGEWANTFRLTYDGNSVTGYPADDEEFTWKAEGAHLTVTAQKKAHYILSGTSADGCLTIEGAEKKAWVELNGLTLTCGTGPTIQKQSDKRLYLTVHDGTTNTLCDGTTYIETAGVDQKGTIFAEKKLIINGRGLLNIASTCTAGKNAIASDDYIRIRKNTNINITSTTKNGIKANDSIIIEGGVLNISARSTAGKGLSSDGTMLVKGGRTTVITTGGGTTDSDGATACAAIKTDGTFRMTGGTLRLKSTGQGGKGISSDQDIRIDGGILRVITTGTRYGDSAGGSQFGRPGGGSSASSDNRTSPKGLKADANIYIAGGDIAVRCTGGEGSEGIESKAAVYISGGTVQASCYDDCVNAASTLNISGGNIYAYSSTNDGLDSNGTIAISGGVVVSAGSTVPEEGIDCDQGNFAITGGVVIGVGGATSTPTASSCTQPSIIYGGSIAQGTLVTLADANSAHILSYTIPRSYNQLTMLVSSPLLTSGSAIYMHTGSSLTGTTAFHGLQTGGSLTEVGNSLTSTTLSSMVTTLGNVNSGMGGGGTPPDGGPGGRR